MITVIKGQTGLFDPFSEYVDSGWDISGTFASHSACNPGTMYNQVSGLVVGRTYVVTYEIDNYKSGVVRALLGTTQGANRSSNGVFTETLLCAGTATFGFYSDGMLRIRVLKYYERPEEAEVNNATTIVFNDEVKRWMDKRSYVPEFMLKFIEKFFTFKNGQLWLHDAGQLHNNFYGVQYNSSITFYVNVNRSMVKTLRTIRIQGDKLWACPNDNDIVILPTEGKPLGMKSRIKPGNFKNYQGDWFADFLRNMIDPRFDSPLKALLKAEHLQGKVVAITITNEGSEQAILVSVDVKMDVQNYTY